MAQHQSFTYIAPTHITPIACPHCGGAAHLMRRTPLKDVLPYSETRTFECAACDKQFEMTVED